MHPVSDRLPAATHRGGQFAAAVFAIAVGASLLFLPAGAFAQAPGSPGGPSAEPPRILNVPAGDDLQQALSSDRKSQINFVTLLLSGGVFMIPIALLSMLVATIGVERAISLRRGRILPGGLVAGLSELGSRGGFDPRQAYQICRDYPSATANVVRAMLLKIGRPHGEVEGAVKDACNREANRLYANVRWLTFAAALSPLLGLLGTIWGMIIAFHDTTQLPLGVDKGTFLAEGIYIALVTTLAGLLVAIVGASLAHWFEARIQGLFLEVEELLFHLLPQVERYEGRVRFAQSDEASATDRVEPAGAPERGGAPPAPPVGSTA